jgi:hypothetical protein
MVGLKAFLTQGCALMEGRGYQQRAYSKSIAPQNGSSGWPASRTELESRGYVRIADTPGSGRVAPVRECRLKFVCALQAGGPHSENRDGSIADHLIAISSPPLRPTDCW